MKDYMVWCDTYKMMCTCRKHFCYSTTFPLQTKLQKRQTQLWKNSRRSICKDLQCFGNLYAYS